MKKIVIGAAAVGALSFGAFLGAATAANDSLNSSPNRRAENPPDFNQLINSQNTNQMVVESPHVDDYKGSNTPIPPISTVVFNGPTVLSEDELNAIAQPYLDRPITDNDIAALKNAITNAYVKKHHPLVKVATPTQDVRSGQLIVNIYEGKVGQVVVNSNGVLQPYIPFAFGARLNSGVFDEKQAEGVVNDLNEINNTSSSITLRPGLAPLTTDVVINTQKGGNQDVNYIAADNYGSKYTGRYVGELHLEKTDALGLGEKLSADGRLSDDGLWAGGANIKIPTGVRNTYFEAGYLYSHNDIVDRLAFLNANGSSQNLTFAFSGNILSEDSQKLTLRVGIDSINERQNLDHSLDTKDYIRRPFAQATYLGLAPEISTVALADVKVSKGADIFGASERGDEQLSRNNGDPETWIINPSLYIRHDFTQHDRLSLYGQGQYSPHETLSSDLFILGGYGSVRGFEPAEEVGDSGFAYQAELMHEFPITEGTSVSVGPWTDGGHVYNRVSGIAPDTALYSAGVGAQLATNIIPIGETTIRLDWAHPLGNYTSNDVHDNSYYFRVQQDF